MSATEPGEWMTLSAAALRLGWARARVESRSRREEWPKRQPNRGTAHEYLVPNSVLTEVATDRDGVPSPPPSDGALTETIAELQAELTELRTASGRTETVLRTEASAATAELKAELRRSSDLTAAVAAERARGDRLELALAEVRRPWLVRAIEGLRRR